MPFSPPTTPSLVFLVVRIERRLHRSILKTFHEARVCRHRLLAVGFAKRSYPASSHPCFSARYSSHDLFPHRATLRWPQVRSHSASPNCSPSPRPAFRLESTIPSAKVTNRAPSHHKRGCKTTRCLTRPHPPTHQQWKNCRH
jgi:hypothetical protein